MDFIDNSSVLPMKGFPVDGRLPLEARVVPLVVLLHVPSHHHALQHKTLIKSLFQAGRSLFQAGRKNNKSGAERGAKADSRPGPRNKVNAMSEDIFEKFFLIGKTL